jgi:hypothetical protein
MSAGEPRVRHRGFFLHSDTTGESDSVEQENPEGFVVRVRVTASHISKQPAGRVLTSPRLNGGRSKASAVAAADEGMPSIRSGSVTGSRQRVHSIR